MNIEQGVIVLRADGKAWAKVAGHYYHWADPKSDLVLIRDPGRCGSPEDFPWVWEWQRDELRAARLARVNRRVIVEEILADGGRVEL